jgi:septal ring factor EnvC (AmiA/AmiB activator)
MEESVNNGGALLRGRLFSVGTASPEQAEEKSGVGSAMHTYQIRESGTNRKSFEEMILGIVVLVLLVVCAFAGVSASSRTTSRESFSLQRARVHATRIEQLQTRDEMLEGEIKRLSKALENTRSDLASFRQVHDTLITQVATATNKVRELEASIQSSQVQASKLKEYAAMREQLQKERDEAVSRAKDAAERIRELTLKLQRAGVSP